MLLMAPTPFVFPTGSWGAMDALSLIQRLDGLFDAYLQAMRLHGLAAKPASGRAPNAKRPSEGRFISNPLP